MARHTKKPTPKPTNVPKRKNSLKVITRLTRVSEAKRLDIQVLRGIAILAVLIDHLPLPRQILESGFRGVDMFFVISGFVITSSLIRRSSTGEKISPVNFLLQRIRRLYPAFFFVMIFSLLVLISADWMPYMERGVSQSAMAGTWYFQNFWMLNQSFSYFEPKFANPFTHLWSLSVEEQFYILVAAGLVVLKLVKRKKSFIFIVTLTFLVFSALANLKWGEKVSPIIKFTGDLSGFLLPQYRAWQLLLGVLTALFVSGLLPTRTRPFALIPAWLYSLSYGVTIYAIAVSLILPEPHPGLNGAEFRVRIFATIICAATALILILGSFPKREKLKPTGSNFFTRVTIFFGDRSYSLYLIHWPFIVFIPEFFHNQKYIWTVQLVLILVCAEFIYRTIEWKWIARSLTNCRVLTWFVVGQLFLTSIIIFWQNDISNIDSQAQGVAVASLTDAQCGNYNLPFYCVTDSSSEAIIFVEGDSFALMVSPLILELARKQEIPVAFGINMADLPLGYYRNLATDGKKTVVLSWFNHFDPSVYISHLSELLSSDKTLHVFAFLNGPSLGGDRLTKISRKSAMARRDREIELRTVLSRPEFVRLTLVDPLDSFCEGDVCTIQSGDAIYMSDRGHLSTTGVEILRPIFNNIFLEIESLTAEYTKNP